jgi:membrane protein DedA with SNARE-associated domain
MEAFLNQYGYIALFIGTFLEGETAILIASSLVHNGLFDFLYTVFFGFAGSFVSDWMYFIIGRFNGKYFIDRRPKLKSKVKPVQDFFRKHQFQILVSYRFLYGFRILIPLIVGMSGIKATRYLLYTIVSGLLWSLTVGSAGYAIGRFLNIQTSVYEENVIYIILGFALFGVLIGYSVKQFAMRKLHVPS